MRTITRIDDITGQTLFWCGGGDFNIIEVQRKLNLSGLSIQEIREDKWAVLGPMDSTGEQENDEQE